VVAEEDTVDLVDQEIAQVYLRRKVIMAAAVLARELQYIPIMVVEAVDQAVLAQTPQIQILQL
jgi:hypothetical protein